MSLIAACPFVVRTRLTGKKGFPLCYQMPYRAKKIFACRQNAQMIVIIACGLWTDCPLDCCNNGCMTFYKKLPTWFILFLATPSQTLNCYAGKKTTKQKTISIVSVSEGRLHWRQAGRLNLGTGGGEMASRSIPIYVSTYFLKQELNFSVFVSCR